MDHGCSVQWNIVVAMAVSIAASLCGGSVPGGGSTKWVSGSATPKNISPMPIPALNIIATHETVRNSGSSPSRPRGMRPYRLNASHSEKITKPVAARTNSQPRFVSSQSSIASAAELRPPVSAPPQITNEADSTAATP
ncbi:hypothetical protein GCM10023178_41090 [Actinomadura luteofluorescens]